jgi:hypothetical protein
MHDRGHAKEAEKLIADLTDAGFDWRAYRDAETKKRDEREEGGLNG